MFPHDYLIYHKGCLRWDVCFFLFFVFLFFFFWFVCLFLLLYGPMLTKTEIIRKNLKIENFE